MGKWKTVGIEFKSDKRKLARAVKISPFTMDVDTFIVELRKSGKEHRGCQLLKMTNSWLKPCMGRFYLLKESERKKE